MRLKEIEKHQLLVSKFVNNDDLYELLDLTKLAMDTITPGEDFYLYIRSMLSRKEEEMRHGR